MIMKPLALIVASAASLAGLSGAAEARQRDEVAVREAREAGAVMPLPQIEDRIKRRVPGATYLGPEYDPGSSTYRLKFMRSGSVIWVDVDGRTGAILGRSGN